MFSHFSCFSHDITENKKNCLGDVSIYNSLLSSAISLAPQIHTILSVLKKLPNIIACGMSGSGSTCFGIFNDINSTLTIADYFEDSYFIWYGKIKDYSVNRVRCSKMLENKF